MKVRSRTHVCLTYGGVPLPLLLVRHGRKKRGGGFSHVGQQPAGFAFLPSLAVWINRKNFCWLLRALARVARTRTHKHTCAVCVICDVSIPSPTAARQTMRKSSLPPPRTCVRDYGRKEISCPDKIWKFVPNRTLMTEKRGAGRSYVDFFGRSRGFQKWAKRRRCTAGFDRCEYKHSTHTVKLKNLSTARSCPFLTSSQENFGPISSVHM